MRGTLDKVISVSARVPMEQSVVFKLQITCKVLCHPEALISIV